MLNKIAEKAKELGFSVTKEISSIYIDLTGLQLRIYDTTLDVFIYSDSFLSNEDLYYMEKLGKLMYYIRELRIDKLLNKE